METSSPESSSSSASSSSSMQHVPQLNNGISMRKSLKKKDASTIIRDTTNTVEPVQVEGTLVGAQDTLQQQATFHMEDVTYESFKTLLRGGTFLNYFPLTNISKMIASQNVSFGPFNINMGEHIIGFLLFRTPNTLSIKLSLSYLATGQISVRLSGYLEPYEKGKSQECVHLNFAKGLLINNEILPLGGLEEIQRLTENYPYVYLGVRLSIDPIYREIVIASDSWEQMTLRETQQTSDHIKRVLDTQRFGEVEKLGNIMPRDEFLKCLSPSINTLHQYRNTIGNLNSHEASAFFFMHGNMEVIEDVITRDPRHVDAGYNKNGDLEIALVSVYKEGRCGRFVEFLEARRKKNETNDDEFPKEAGIPSPFEGFLGAIIELLAPEENGMPLKHFFAFHDEFDKKYTKVLESFRQQLIRHLRWYSYLDPAAKVLFDDLVGQPFLLTPTSFCYAFLFDDIEYSRDREEEEKAMLIFVDEGWSEAIRVGLKGKYKSGGECLWEFMTRKFPDRFVGEFPQDDESLKIVCDKFPTKLQLEEEWIKKNAAIYLTTLVDNAPIFDFLPKVLWMIVSQYVITWFDAETTGSGREWCWEDGEGENDSEEDNGNDNQNGENYNDDTENHLEHDPFNFQ